MALSPARGARAPHGLSNTRALRVDAGGKRPYASGFQIPIEISWLKLKMYGTVRPIARLDSSSALAL
jgi:hypothetical protein